MSSGYDIELGQCFERGDVGIGIVHLIKERIAVVKNLIGHNGLIRAHEKDLALRIQPP